MWRSITVNILFFSHLIALSQSMKKDNTEAAESSGSNLHRRARSESSIKTGSAVHSFGNNEIVDIQSDSAELTGNNSSDEDHSYYSDSFHSADNVNFTSESDGDSQSEYDLSEAQKADEAKIMPRVMEFRQKHTLVRKLFSLEGVKERLDQEEAREPMFPLLIKVGSDGGGTADGNANILQRLNNFMTHIHETKPIHHLVLACKLFIRELLLESERTDWLALSKWRSDQGYKLLDNIVHFFMVQSEGLDLLVNASIFQEHLNAIHERGLEHKKAAAPNRAVIVGAGPIGLYTAFQFFSAGINIVLVNDRPERYLRRQHIFLYPHWILQLRFLLGTRFEPLFEDDDAPGKLESLERGTISLFDLETALKERLVSLVNFVENIDKMNAVRNDFERIELRYETAVKQVDYPTQTDPNFYAVLVTPENRSNSDQAVFNGNLLQSKTDFIKRSRHIGQGEAKNRAFVQLISEKLDGIMAEQPSALEDPIAFKPAGRDTVREWLIPAKMAKKMVQGKALEMKKLPKIPMDILVCAGGANDGIRDNYIEHPKLLAIPGQYAVAVVEKYKAHFVFNNLVDIKREMGYPTMLEKVIKEQNFNKMVKSSRLLGSQIQRKYRELTDLILNGLVEDGAWTLEGGQKYRMENGKGNGKGNGKFYLTGKRTPGQVAIRILESQQRMTIGASVPAALWQFFVDLEKRKRVEIEKETQELNGNEIAVCLAFFGGKVRSASRKLKAVNERIMKISQAYNELRKRFERKWLIAVFTYAQQSLPRSGQPVEVNEPRSRFHFLTKKPSEQGILFNVASSGKLIHWDKKMARSAAEAQQMLLFDDTQTSSFILRAQALEKPVDLKTPEFGHDTSLLAMALGDSLASPHFFSATGLNVGQSGVDIAAQELRHASPTYSLEVKEQLTEKLEPVKEEVRKDVLQLKLLKMLPTKETDEEV